MAQARIMQTAAHVAEPGEQGHLSMPAGTGLTEGLVGAAFEAERGISKAHAARLFQRVAATSPQPLGKLRAELIPDSSWKRAGKTLGPQASQTTVRLGHVLALAERVWGNEADATEWLNRQRRKLLPRSRRPRRSPRPRHPAPGRQGVHRQGWGCDAHQA